MAQAREIPGIDAAASFRAAAASAVEVRAEEVFEHLPRALDTSDIEGVHDTRVATRRLRAAMEIFAPAFPRRLHRELLRDVKALADALGERRDPDVAIAELERIATALTAEDRPGIEHLIAELRGEQQAANERLATALAEVEQGELRSRLAVLVEAAQP